jgi:hypothetical protein
MRIDPDPLVAVTVILPEYCTPGVSPVPFAVIVRTVGDTPLVGETLNQLPPEVVAAEALKLTGPVDVSETICDAVVDERAREGGVATSDPVPPPPTLKVTLTTADCVAPDANTTCPW